MKIYKSWKKLFYIVIFLFIIGIVILIGQSASKDITPPFSKELPPDKESVLKN